MICNCFDIIKRSAENGTIGTTEEKNRDWCKWRFRHHLCHHYSNKDLGAAVASGSFLTDGMIIVPASMKTVAGISVGLGDNLIARAADVTMKEQRKLVIVPRETPLNAIHLENLTKLARLGVQIIPPIPAFYNQPQTIQDLVNHHTMKLLDQFGIVNEHSKRWQGD